MANKRVTLRGRGQVTLSDGNYVTSGGEGSIYRLNDTIVKLYTDTAKAARDGMADKIALLSTLTHDSIVAPVDQVTNARDGMIGYYMPFRSGEPLPRLFVNDFRTRTGFGDADAISLIEQMRVTIDYAHSAGAVLADANELNWIVDYPGVGQQPKPYVIDVDSWAVGRWPATVMMPSIRDWSTTTIDSASDWYAWGILAFQVLVGIHPFRGRLDGYKPNEMERRMRERKSVFATGVRLPSVVRDFGVIPGPLLDWFRATFDTAARSAPPSAMVTGGPAVAARVLRTVLTSSTGCTHEKIFEVVNRAVLRTWPCGAALLDTGTALDIETKQSLGQLSASCEIIKTVDGWLTYSRERRQDVFCYVSANTNIKLDWGVAADRIWRAGNRLFALVGNELLEVKLQNYGRAMLTTESVIHVPVLSTQWFDGVAVVDNLGAKFLLVPLEDGTLGYTKCGALDSLTVIEAIAAGGFITLLSVDATGKYVKSEVIVATGAYWSSGTDLPQLNVAPLTKGVAASIFEDGELVLYVPSSGTIKRIADRGVTTALRLATWGERVIYCRDGAVWRLKAS